MGWIRGVKYYTLPGLSCHFVGHVELQKSTNEEQSRNDEHGERNHKVMLACRMIKVVAMSGKMDEMDKGHDI
jgi:hypothetical protein